jgi:hypothetical protein
VLIVGFISVPESFGQELKALLALCAGGHHHFLIERTEMARKSLQGIGRLLIGRTATFPGKAREEGDAASSRRKVRTMDAM